jgi:hypothetical protein
MVNCRSSFGISARGTGGEAIVNEWYTLRPIRGGMRRHPGPTGFLIAKLGCIPPYASLCMKSPGTRRNPRAHWRGLQGRGLQGPRHVRQEHYHRQPAAATMTMEKAMNLGERKGR